ncbi:helix-turn-helix domain-containing protein [Dactylosporangium vinaceum]|uniref:Helix-turn-helix domain-containing protein n=1 Tax=Dactylosporangium vinaceum TaxID=53362 RepID=A0ABV5MBW5_9ACTN|nr:helix-turn-helix transcriptional regulator [Dactylosporangium vinaceum]UAC01320.1 helix-turn-helix domain-containing protein [Dactylosporangium vinaceum]
MDGTNRLGEYLKARRAQIRPPASTGRRRVPGLRRSELASAAGISEQYLTRLEQGHDRHPSDQVLHALARALELDDDARAHLRRLAAPPASPSHGRPPEVLAEGAQELLDAWSGIPAYVRGRHFDVLAANALAQALVPTHRPGRNLVRDVFLAPQMRTFYADWPTVATSTVAAVRTAAGANPNDEALTALINDLLDQSADFRALWSRHDAQPTRDERKLFRHPALGTFHLYRHVLAIADSNGQVIIAYRPPPGSDILTRLT